MLSAAVFFLTAALTGCVAIPTHERGVTEAYHRGVLAGMNRSLKIVEGADDKDAAAKDLKYFLGCEEYK